MLTETNLAKVGNFDQATIDQLRDALGGGADAVSAAGALSLLSYETQLTVSGTVAYTLAAPTVIGQKKRIVCVSAASTPLGTVTITAPDTVTGFALSSTFVFTAVGQALELVATAALLWRAARVQRAGTQAVVVGTTVLTGLNLAHNYLLSVTGTVSSTTTKSLPNGNAVGEICMISNPTAASTPIGNINFTGMSILGVAATDLQAIGATTDTAAMQWTGVNGWQIIYSTGITVA